MGKRLPASLSLAALFAAPALCSCAASERPHLSRAAEGTRRIVHAEDVRALSGVTRLVGDLVLERATLASLEGLTLEAVTGDVVVRGNASLDSLEGLERLAHVGGRLLVERNPRLTSLFELSALRTVGGEVRILENATLATCEAQALGAQMQQRDEDARIFIEGNDDRASCPGEQTGDVVDATVTKTATALVPATL